MENVLLIFSHFEGTSLLQHVLITNFFAHKTIGDQSIIVEKVLYNLFHRSNARYVISTFDTLHI